MFIRSYAIRTSRGIYTWYYGIGASGEVYRWEKFDSFADNHESYAIDWTMYEIVPYIGY